MKSNPLVAILLVAGIAVTPSLSKAASFTLSSPTIGPNQPGVFTVDGTVTVGAGESVVSPNLISTVWLPFLPSFAAGFNYNCGNFDSNFLAWNGTSPYTGKILDFNVNPNDLGYSGGMPVGIYNFDPFGPGAHPGVSLDWLDPNGGEHSMVANYHVTVESTPEPATMAFMGIGALALRLRRKRQK